MADQQFCLRWNNHQSTVISVFDMLFVNETMTDCTLAAEGQFLKAHKVLLSACSPYFETLLSQHYEKHPIVILKDVKFTELKSMMDYMYRGEVNISQDQLGTFLKTAESLQIKGLTENGDGDARDVGSTPKAPPSRRATQPASSSRPETEEPPSPPHRSRDGSISPSSRKRRRIRRNSQEDDSNLGDSHLETSNSCDLPSQAQAAPLVPNIPATVTSSITTTPIVKTPIIKPETESNLVNRLDTSNLNSLPPESGLLKEKIEPLSEPLLEPKTEYDVNNDDSVEDLTLDDDDDMDGMDISNMSNLSNMSRPGPSHGNDISNQGFAPWHLGNQAGTDEVFMAAQEAVSAHRDSQGTPKFTFASCGSYIEEMQFKHNQSLNVETIGTSGSNLTSVSAPCMSQQLHYSEFIRDDRQYLRGGTTTNLPVYFIPNNSTSCDSQWQGSKYITLNTKKNTLGSKSTKRPKNVGRPKKRGRPKGSLNKKTIQLLQQNKPLSNPLVSTKNSNKSVADMINHGVKRKVGRPKGSKNFKKNLSVSYQRNHSTVTEVVAVSSDCVQDKRKVGRPENRKRGRPKGSLNKTL